MATIGRKYTGRFIRIQISPFESLGRSGVGAALVDWRWRLYGARVKKILLVRLAEPIPCWRVLHSTSTSSAAPVLVVLLFRSLGSDIAINSAPLISKYRCGSNKFPFIARIQSAPNECAFHPPQRSSVAIGLERGHQPRAKPNRKYLKNVV